MLQVVLREIRQGKYGLGKRMLRRRRSSVWTIILGGANPERARARRVEVCVWRNLRNVHQLIAGHAFQTLSLDSSKTQRHRLVA
jgi:hypothetical protein